MKRSLAVLVLFGGFNFVMANDIPDLSGLVVDQAQSANTNQEQSKVDKPEDSTVPDLQIPSLETLPQNNENTQTSQEALPDLNISPLTNDKNIPKPEPKEDTIELPKEKFSAMPEEKKGIIKSGPGVAKQEADKKRLETKKAKQEAKNTKKAKAQVDTSLLPNLEVKENAIENKSKDENIQDLGDLSNISRMKEASDNSATTSVDAASKVSDGASENQEELNDEAYLYDEDDHGIKLDQDFSNTPVEIGKSKEVSNDNNATKDEKSKDVKSIKAPKVQLEENTASSKSDANKEVSFVQEDFYELDDDDFEFEVSNSGKNKEYLLRVTSLDLEAFVNGQSYDEKNQVQTFGVNDNFTQILSKDGRIKEYKFYQKGAKKNTILNTMRMPLEKIDFDTFKIVAKSLPHFFDATACKVIIKKELNATLNQSKEVIMDLDIKRELKNTTNFKLFLECPR